ncbi:putative exonuclease domain-containing protein At3g15140 [Primulina tabacum]|uniref:putative exonuclease domain-containing protein At3g15140 n=1 Tax=Primulina tabacum TaxID=48773 RepID=UPI003F59CA3C
MATWKTPPSLRRTLFVPPSLSLPPLLLGKNQSNRNTIHCSSSATEESTIFSPIWSEIRKPDRDSSWKPMCLYNSQGICTKMEDPLHVQRFNHSFSVGSVPDLKKFRAQEFDYFLVLDLEGKVEILEFPVMLFDVKNMDVLDVFHRFVRPTKMSEQRINEYIEGKYGAFGVDRVWHDTAVKFEEVIEQFEAWLDKHKLCGNERGGCLEKGAFVICGNWDLKTSIPRQCAVSNMKLPPYFMEWINLKDVYLNFYNTRAPGMLSMMRGLQIPPLGSHHLGIDDARNIARVLRHMLTDGAILKITARKSPDAPDNVKFLFQNRVR